MHGYTCHGDIHVTVTVTQLALGAIIENNYKLKLHNKTVCRGKPPKRQGIIATRRFCIFFSSNALQNVMVEVRALHWKWKQERDPSYNYVNMMLHQCVSTNI